MEYTTDFFEQNDHALRSPSIVLRDSLGLLAVQILSVKFDLSTMSYDDMLIELHTIINDLHSEYHHHGSFTE